jgi:transposase
MKRKLPDGVLWSGRISKKALRERKTLFLLDETAFYLLPALVRSYGPRGIQSEMSVPLTKDHLSVIGGITPRGEFSLSMKEESLEAPDVIWFIRHLLNRFNKVLLVWDGSSIHGRSVLVRQFIERVGDHHLTVAKFPGYAPELNPTEGLWKHLKHVELKNVCAQDLEELRIELQLASNRVRSQLGLVQSFFGQPPLDISDFT